MNREAAAASFLKPSVVSGLALLRKRAAQAPGQPWEVTVRLAAASHQGQGVDLDRACQLHELLPADLVDSPGLYRAAILLTAKQLPPWLGQLRSGREFLSDAGADLRSCFERAGALDAAPDQTVISWWDDLAGLAYGTLNQAKMDVGRRAERLSLEREQRRLESFPGHPPIQWTALDSNAAGYDILSWSKRDGHWYPMYLEVKGFSTSPAKLYLTRNEWETAKRLADDFHFQVWDVGSNRMAQLSTSQMLPHVPSDEGMGRWEVLCVEVSEDFFTPA
ncbi:MULTISPECIES: DUF3883 domain-containing protein [Stenotrophomonas]|uniref:DUF3883 domain-containing protein n=1 Tax=Stenotrophomonas TaxID=40323 RepID=UPI000368C505|nr:MULTISPECIES: DUF3883 domain-containing protein [Stenotrophomonas]MCU1002749.1 DUF3883 domain-containing protein [Stenotrophomonas maltophilia]